MLENVHDSVVLNDIFWLIILESAIYDDILYDNNQESFFYENSMIIYKNVQFMRIFCIPGVP